jgi:hypothetical protein
MAEDTGKADYKFTMLGVVAAVSMAINCMQYLNSPMVNILGLAAGITVGFACVAMTMYFIFTNQLIKMRMMRIFSPNKNYGIWGIVEPGKAVILRVASFKVTHFKDGERVFPMPDEKCIKRIGNGPFVLFDSRDAKALSLDGEETEEVTRSPGKLHAFCDMYTALAEAAARRKNKFNPKQMMMVLYGVLVLQLISVYYGYAIQDYLVKNIPLLVNAASGVVQAAATGIK